MPLTAGAAERLIEHTGGNPLHLRAVLRELPATGSWLYDDRALPVPRPYAHLVDAQLRRCPPDVVTLLDAVAVLGVRAPAHAALPLAALADPLPTVDRAASTGLLRVAERDDGTWLEFTHPLTRAAVHEAMPHARRSQLHGAAATLALSPDAALHHRVEAHTGADEDLRAELEHAAARAARPRRLGQRDPAPARRAARHRRAGRARAPDAGRDRGAALLRRRRRRPPARRAVVRRARRAPRQRLGVPRDLRR